VRGFGFSFLANNSSKYYNKKAPALPEAIKKNCYKKTKQLYAVFSLQLASACILPLRGICNPAVL